MDRFNSSQLQKRLGELVSLAANEIPLTLSDYIISTMWVFYNKRKETYYREISFPDFKWFFKTAD